MKHILFAVATLATLVSRCALAAAPPAGDPLAPLGWFVGTWVADITGSDGKPLRVETKFEWAEHGRALKYSIHFKTGDQTIPQYEGMYFWHPAKKQIAMIQVDRNGNVTESIAKVEGDTLTQENQATTADGTTRPQRVAVVRDGNDAFRFKALVQREGNWVEGLNLTYKRQSSGSGKP
jgi:hypothetical protein